MKFFLLFQLNDEIKVETLTDDYVETEEMMADDCQPYLEEEEEDEPLECKPNTSHLLTTVQETLQEKSDFNSFNEYPCKKIDEHQLFGEFVAQELRGLKSEESRKKLKRKILQVVIDIGEEDD